MKKIRFQQHLFPHLLAYLLFIGAVVSFFSPIFLQNKKLFQGDIPHHEGIAKQLVEYRQETGQEALWNNRVFSGMPAYLLDVHYQEPLTNCLKAMVAGFMPTNVGYIFTAMLACYILLLSFGIQPYVAIAGSLAYGLSTFTLISIGIGHDGKVAAMAWMPLVVAGVHIAYTQHRWWGGMLTALGLMLELSATHPQITYYLMLMLIMYGISQLIVAIQAKQFSSFIHTSVVLSLACLLAVSANFGRLWHIYEYGAYSIRGQSELQAAQSQAVSGLDKAYAFKWSLGKAETLTLLVPNFFGGSSHECLGQDAQVARALQKQGFGNRQIKEFLQAMPTYWGDQPFTEGPMYLGAITCFLFCLGLWIVPKQYRYWLLASTVLAVLLAWGHNFPWFNNLMYAHFPGYNKFRAVTTAIVMAQLSASLLGCLALEQLCRQGFTPAVRQGFRYTWIILGGILVASLAFSELKSYAAPHDASLPAWLVQALKIDRKGMLQKDVLRSLFFILAVSVSIGGYWKNKLQANHLAMVVVLLMFVDYYGVAKRYVRATSYKTQKQIDALDETPAKQFINQDKTLGYRVFNLNNPFNDGRTSYHHHAVGGYHGAKLQRYQDLIQHHLINEHARILAYMQGKVPNLTNLPVLNMLNTRYFVASQQQAGIITNNHALGNAWFVESIYPVNNPLAALEALKDINPQHMAIIDTTQFAVPCKSRLGKGQLQLKVYQPNYIHYEAEALADGLAVFAEIYYPKGWQACLDGQPVEHIRVNYILRALAVPAGKHRITFTFAPYSYKLGNQIMLFTSLLMFLLLILGGIYSLQVYQRNGSFLLTPNP